MTMECEIDRLSALPDNILICNIFSHLSLKDVIRTSLLSSQWPFLWKEIHHLNFSEDFFQTLKLSSENWPFNENPQQKAKYLNEIIDNILLLHSGHIERFSVDPCLLEPEVFEALRVEQWVQHAALKGVKHMSLNNFSATSKTPPSLPSSLFACHLLRDLEIEYFCFTDIPIEFDGFRSLQSLSLSRLFHTTNDGLRQLIELCPLLHKLVLKSCWDLSNLKIQAPNLNSLKILGCYDLVSLTVDCPQLVELEIASCCDLIDFKTYSCELFHDLHASDVQIRKNHPMPNSLKKLSLKSCRRISDLTLLTILGCFCNLEEVHIQTQIYEKDNSEQERANGVVVADLTFPSLKKVYVDVSAFIKEEEAFMLAFLLNHAPSLNTMTVILPYSHANIHNKKFINKVMDLQQMYEKVDIRIKIDEEDLDIVCRLSHISFPDDFPEDLLFPLVSDCV